MQFGNEWGIQKDKHGHWNLLFTYNVPKLAQPTGPITLSGPIIVKLVDPGAQTPFTVYSLQGLVTEIGNEENGSQLHQLCLCDDALCSCCNQRPLATCHAKGKSR